MKKRLTDCPERDLAKSRGERFYFIDAPCRNGHTGKRYVNGGGCWACGMDEYRGERTETHALAVPTSVYVIEAGEYIKVGLAENILKRLQVLKTHCPLPVRVAFCSRPIPRSEARKIEQSCHSFLIKFHVHGEWFKTDAVSAIKFINLAEDVGYGVLEEKVQLRLVD